MTDEIIIIDKLSKEHQEDLLDLYENEYWTHDIVEKISMLF